MPYGGTLHAPVDADLVQADVDSIVQGLTGLGGQTLTDLEDLLRNGLYAYGGTYPQLELLKGLLEGWLNNHLYDTNNGQPWLQTVHYDLMSYLFALSNFNPLVANLSSQLASILAVLTDVYDSTQHALRTV